MPCSGRRGNRASEVEVGLLGLPRQNIEPSSLQEKLHVDLTGQGSRGKRHRGRAEGPETPAMTASPTCSPRAPTRRSSGSSPASSSVKRLKSTRQRSSRAPTARTASPTSRTHSKTVCLGGVCVGGGARPTAMSLCPGEKGRRVLRSHLSSSSARKLNTHSSYHDVAAQHWRCAHSAYRAHCFPCWHTAANCSTKTNDLR